MNAYELAQIAEVHSPDSLTSPGAEWLASVADSFEVDDFENANAMHDAVAELADAAVPCYTHNRWQVFVDLCAYQEDISDLGGSTEDMTEAAGIALYMIAERLLTALIAPLID